MIYIIPDTGDFTELQTVTSRSQLPVLTPQTVREYVLQTEQEHTALVAVKAQDMTVLARHAATLLSDMPTVVMAAPGMLYPADWMTAVSTFPPVDWLTVEKTLAKSGETAYTPEQAESRDKGAPISLKRVSIGAGFSEEGEVTPEDIE